MFSNSSASPSLRLPGLLHYREGFIPLTVAPTPGPPARRMLPWSTCGHTQGLVRITPPSSTECNFMSQLSIRLNLKNIRNLRRRSTNGTRSLSGPKWKLIGTCLCVAFISREVKPRSKHPTDFSKVLSDPVRGELIAVGGELLIHAFEACSVLA